LNHWHKIGLIWPINQRNWVCILFIGFMGLFLIHGDLIFGCHFLWMSLLHSHCCPFLLFGVLTPNSEKTLVICQFNSSIILFGCHTESMDQVCSSSFPVLYFSVDSFFLSVEYPRRLFSCKCRKFKFGRNCFHCMWYFQIKERL
jgi:hypothetical protein